MLLRRRGEIALAALLGLTACGCFTPAESAKSEAASRAESPAASAKSSSKEEQQLASIGKASAAKSPVAPTKSDPPAPVQSATLEPFQAPPLADLDAKAEWQAQPILDGVELMRERQSHEKPLATVEEALALQNTNADANAKINSALGRLPAKESDVDWNASFLRSVAADVKSTNPVLITSIYEFELNNLIGLALFNFDWRLEPFACKATIKSWQTSKDHLYDKLVLRDDVTWSDGQPVTAHDVVFSFKLILDPRVPVPTVRSGVDQIRWIEAYDDHTLVYFHKQAAPTNVWNLNFPIVPRHIYENYGDDVTLQNSPRFVKYENEPVVGGPYAIKERRRNEEIVLERRENYHMYGGKQVRAKPFLKTIRLRVIPDQNTALLALKNGDIDEMQLSPLSLWRTQTVGDDFYRANTKAQGVEWTTIQFIWNCETPFFSDKRVRNAMSYAMDYDEMLNTVLGGLASPCSGLFHPDAWMAARPAPQPFKQDLDKAEALLKEAGWEDHDGDGVRDKVIDGKTVKFDFDLICTSADPDGIRICTLLKENLDRLGIACTVRPLEFTVLTQKELDHKFQASLGRWGTGADPDTTEYIYTTQGATRGRNFGSYSNPEVDALYRRGKTEFDRDKRAEIYGQIQRLLWEDQPYTWLFYRNSLYAFGKKVRGYVFSPRGPFNYSPGMDTIWKPVQ
ncbi:MAG TPA: peptide-binding protein [Planctomycetaceae bacterium]|jgi:peptide/nickel transport system substrate-binding protein|nr:peptide-binding protein [Planctomycetaceae bacterium]